MTERRIAISDFLTDEELDRAVKLYHEVRRSDTATASTFAKRCADEIIAPVLPRINAKLGQENDAKYLAYAVEYVMNELSRKGN